MFRINVAALIRCRGQFVGCGRSDYHTWQCVQGGMELTDISPRHAIERELQEELGLSPNDYHIVYQSRFWRRYYFTKKILAKQRFKNNIGQEQLWFLVDLPDFESIQLEKTCKEFDKIKLLSLPQLLNVYSIWKRASFYDFCREMSLL